MSEEDHFQKQDHQSSGLAAFWAELKRRKVVQGNPRFDALLEN